MTIYLYNDETSEIGIALDKEEKERRFTGRHSGWIEISRDEYFRLRDVANRTIAKFRAEINKIRM